MTFRSDLDALRARHDVLESEVAAHQEELVETRRMIEEVERRARLPVLDNIRVAAPCTADWTKMAGDERVRACGDCNKNVYNLSEMTREEAEALIVEKEGRLCVRYYRRTDGTILFGDCTIGVSRRRRRKLVAGAAALLAATGAVAYGASRAAEADEEAEVMMGVIRAAPPEATIDEWVTYPEDPELEPESELVLGGITVDPAFDLKLELGKFAEPPAPSPPRAK
jgi:hypothetical protein